MSVPNIRHGGLIHYADLELLNPRIFAKKIFLVLLSCIRIDSTLTAAIAFELLRTCFYFRALVCSGKNASDKFPGAGSESKVGDFRILEEEVAKLKDNASRALGTPRKFRLFGVWNFKRGISMTYKKNLLGSQGTFHTAEAA